MFTSSMTTRMSAHPWTVYPYDAPSKIRGRGLYSDPRGWPRQNRGRNTDPGHDRFRWEKRDLQLHIRLIEQSGRAGRRRLDDDAQRSRRLLARFPFEDLVAFAVLQSCFAV